MSKRIAKTPCLGGIYRITCTVEGKEKSYVGSTKHPFRRRWNQHRGGLRRGSHDNQHLQRAWNRHGESAFEFHPLEPVALVEDLIECEQKWIDMYQAFNHDYGFNITPRADHRCHAEETKAKISARMIEIRQDPELRSKVSVFMIERWEDPEHKAMMSDITKERWQDPEYAARMRAMSKGLWEDPEYKAIMSALMIERWQDPARRESLSVRMIEIWEDPEYREKRARSNPFYYRAISPLGTIYDNILNLAEFSREHGLHKGHMSAVAIGKLKHYKGWTCKKIAKQNHP